MEWSSKYGQIIVDECHHLSAFSFEAILKQAKAKYIVGLTATPIRRDGHQPIIFMQCGSLRHSAKTPENIPKHLEVRPQYLTAPVFPPDSTIQDVFRIIAGDFSSNQHIGKDVLAAYSEGRKVLVLAMPISWKGTLQQYAGRLHREHVDKQDVRIYDYVEKDQPQLAGMWDKRQRGYRAMGYHVKSLELMQTPVTRGVRMRYAWLTDIHLEFLGDKEVVAFVKELAAQRFDGLFLTGDISTATKIEHHLQLIEELYQAPVYFVLGNHDYYGGAIETVRKMVEEACNKSKWLHWLPTSGVVALGKDTCLIGHDGWADGRLGDYAGSKVLLNDYVKIQDFVQAGDVGRLALLGSLGDQGAAYLKDILPGALEQYRQVIVLIHIPPFKESCWHKGEISADDWLPHFSCKAVGDVLAKSMAAAPDKQMVVLCGHTHSSGECQILPNLQIKTGGAKYGSPKIQEIIQLISCI